MQIIDTPAAIARYRLLALKSALKLEVLGMKRSRGPSVFSIVKKEFGFKGTKASVLEQFTQHIQNQVA